MATKKVSERLRSIALSKFFDNVSVPEEETALAIATGQTNAVKPDIMLIKNTPNPSEEMQLAAIGKNYRAIQHITNQCEKAQLLALKRGRRGHACQYIKDPKSNAVQFEVVKQCLFHDGKLPFIPSVEVVRDIINTPYTYKHAWNPWKDQPIVNLPFNVDILMNVIESDAKLKELYAVKYLENLTQ